MFNLWESVYIVPLVVPACNLAGMEAAFEFSPIDWRTVQSLQSRQLELELQFQFPPLVSVKDNIMIYLIVSKIYSSMQIFTALNVK